MKTGDTIAAISVSLGALSMLGFLPAHDAYPAIAVLPRTHAPLVAVAHAAPLRRVRSVAPASPPSMPTTVLPLPVAVGSSTAIPTAKATAPAAIAPNPGVLLHAPSVSVAVIAAELAAAGAPFAGEVWAGKPAPRYIYEAAVWWHLDPAVVLGFMHHESAYGRLGMAAQTKGVCNIRPTSGVGYRWYSSWQAGVDDCIRLLGLYGQRYGHNDLAGAVATWAPPTDNNNVPAYVADVEQTVARLHQESH